MNKAVSQFNLFEARAQDMPEGFTYRSDCMTAGEEAVLIKAVETLDFQPFEFHGYVGRRKVVYFGHRYDFSRGKLAEAAPMPAFLLPLRDQAAAFAGLTGPDFPHVLINAYEPGAPIGWHRDRPQFEHVVGVSLGAPGRFRMRRRDAGGGFERREQVVEPRSIYHLTGPARWAWEHSLPPAPALRYSITFRSLKSA